MIIRRIQLATETRRPHFDIYVCFYYYHWADTSAGGLLLSPGRYICWWTITITGPIPLLVDYYYHRADTSAGGLLLSPGRYLCWWTITITGPIPLLVDYYYHRADTSAGGLLVSTGIIRLVVNASALTWFIRFIYC